MPVTAFLSYSRVDEDFVRRLARDLVDQGIEAWIDREEILVGDTFWRRIEERISSADYFIVVLSPDAVGSSWVAREIDAAFRKGSRRDRGGILPVLRRPCVLPEAFAERHFADFTDDAGYLGALRELVTSMRVVFNRTLFEKADRKTHLGSAIDKASYAGFPLLSRPFHRPFQYIGSPVADAVAETGGAINGGGNVIVESPDCRMVLWAEGSMVTSVDAELRESARRVPPGAFDPEPVLGAFSINPAELEHVRSQSHCHSYYDHCRRLKIYIMRDEPTGPLIAGFSKKYYGQ